MIRTTLALLFLALLLGCGSARRGEPLRGPQPDGNPRVSAGRELFMQNCNKCHPGGEGGVGPGLNNKPLPAPAIRTQVREGLGAMPSFKENELSDQQLDEIIDYLFALRREPARDTGTR